MTQDEPANKKRELSALQDQFSELSEKLKANLGPHGKPMVRTYLVVHMVLWKLAMCVADIDAGEPHRSTNHGKSVQVVLRRVYEIITEMVWTKSDEDVVEAVEEALDAVNLYTAGLDACGDMEGWKDGEEEVQGRKKQGKEKRTAEWWQYELMGLPCDDIL
jgi:predicted CopG family antitoxin